MQGFSPLDQARETVHRMVPIVTHFNSHPTANTNALPPTVHSQPITGDHAAARAHRSAVGWALLALALVCHPGHNGLMVASSQGRESSTVCAAHRLTVSSCSLSA